MTTQLKNIQSDFFSLDMDFPNKKLFWSDISYSNQPSKVSWGMAKVWEYFEKFGAWEGRLKIGNTPRGGSRAYIKDGLICILTPTLNCTALKRYAVMDQSGKYRLFANHELQSEIRRIEYLIRLLNDAVA